ncbi:hypothetical protein F5X68DRAFT_163812 [Plectosphaerella plurivora]|uniref:Dihydroxyacid dehydratase n=1 Tax=Plectosphaerella plurivora TaxID=936078 RepID=A0A9P8VMZ9_9PEZI|nr:hypothetical protein F5X68DRAFT_163812 [Plectosphaerella plurivora]
MADTPMADAPTAEALMADASTADAPMTETLFMAEAPVVDAATEGGLYDLLLLTDATGSMASFLAALNRSLPDIIRMSALTDCFSRIGVLAYRDYMRCTDYNNQLTQWSGWHAPGNSALSEVSQPDLITFAGGIRADLGGGAEAAKTGLAKAHSVMRPEATTIIILFADQPPHLPWDTSSDRRIEIEHLSKPDTYGGSGPLFLDWVSAARTLSTGDRKARVFAYIDAEYDTETITSFLYLCDATGGCCIRRQGWNYGIGTSEMVLAILLSWMGLSKSGAPDLDNSRLSFETIATKYDWADPVMASTIPDESSSLFNLLLKQDPSTPLMYQGTGITSLDQVSLHIPPGRPSLQDLSKRYDSDPAYRSFAIAQLNQIIGADINAVTTNPVFGTLWRAVSRDRGNPERDGLLTNFGFRVQSLADPVSRARMTAWLEESYNYREAIADIIKAVPEAERFPCVYLDPTQDFSGISGGVDDDNSDNRDPTKFTRSELLDIGRSCDPKILRRLGKVLTRLSFASDEESLPVHIREASVTDVPRMPMALALEKHGRNLWKVLLHLILPGTKITLRPAALLAALSNRMGMLPLRAAADEELLSFRKHWGSRDVPETWSVSCLSLLLDADQDYERRVSEGTTTRPAPDACVLQSQDRRLFQTLVDYKMLEFNLDTTLTARVGWDPSTSKVAVGPLVTCIKCRLPRSVTIMGVDGICGLCEQRRGCACESCQPIPDQELRVRTNVSVSDNELTEMTWVECSDRACRSQYVVYNFNALRVRPKCFYCRHGSKGAKTPFVECSQCLSRVIWPVEYRPEGMELEEYRCTGCVSGRATIVDCDTSARELAAENGQEWLVRDDGNVFNKTLFTGQSIFNLIQSADVETLASKVTVLSRQDTPQLAIRGKLVQNSADVLASLANWVSRRQVESGTCSLCFSDSRKTDLRSACNRKGCLSLICNTCREGWYGLNARGKIINAAALCCPFCRRRPTPRSAPRELVHLGGLSEAVADTAWIYAWCSRCGFARRHMERVCANGAPQEVENWTCEACQPPRLLPLEGGVVGETVARESIMRECPGCSTMTEKASGCDHITCPCGTHWCYQCGKACSQDDIYRHMSQEHGGYYGGQDYDYDGGGDEYEDDGGW